MERMFAVLADDPHAALAGLIGMICFGLWPLLRTRPAMLSVYMGNNLGFCVHYALLDHWTAVAMNGLMALQTLTAIGLVKHPALRLAYLALVPLMVVALLATWQGLPSLLAAAATTLSIAGRMQGNETQLRALLLASTPFWAGHDLIIGSLPGLIADLLSMTVGATMLLRQLPAATVFRNSGLTGATQLARLPVRSGVGGRPAWPAPVSTKGGKS
jgi:hypothetical protein